MDEITDRKIREYADLVRRIMPVSAIVLYGSHARGEERGDSDIDIAVVVDELRGDFLDVNARLFALCREVDVAIEPKLIVKKNNASGFLESILKYGKVIDPE
ncbi:MAG TPA: nucleotidyltransferase domain-containing protein [Spirochaetota bacterium]|nr:nucleotidyltransferase domain-containing protein [Spirochaetota bacterium]